MPRHRASSHAPGSWYDRILRAVSANGGSASLGDIYAWLMQHGNLTPGNLAPSTNGQPRYYHIVRTYCRELWQRGELERVERGVYRLPESGQPIV